MPEGFSRHEAAVLVVSVLIISACSIVYELLISTLSSYFLGSSVLHFSLTIGLFLFFMGVGSYLSRFFNSQLLLSFIRIEIAVGLIGGLCGIILYAAYSVTDYYYLVALALIAAISTLIGLEIPLLTRLLERGQGLKRSLSNVMSFDYMGALLASIAFPIILIPYLGLMRSAFAVGMVNIAVACVLVYQFRARLQRISELTVTIGLISLLLIAGFIGSFRISGFFEQFLYQDPIVFADQSRYQRIVMTQHGRDLRLFLNGSLQFSSQDEYRYHEPLVHIPMAMARNHEQILILGGGDGLVARELLKYPKVEQITLVDLDPRMTDLASSHALLRDLNQRSLDDARVKVIHQDAYEFIEKDDLLYSVVIIDLPDPSNLDLGKLYSQEFYRLLARRMSADGLLVTQSSSPYFARQAFWSVHKTLESVFSNALGYHSYVPSFGLWGFNIASKYPITPPTELDASLPPGRFLNDQRMASFFEFDADTNEIDAEVNRLENQILVRYYEQSWNSIN